MSDQGHEGHGHGGHGHGAHDHGGHGHGHENDQGIRGALRYLRWLPEMWSSEVNDAVVDEIAPAAGECVIDIGAGIGAGSMRAAAAGADVVAVEPTPIMRRSLAARRLLSRHRAHLRVAEGAAESLPVADDSADAVWAVNTMHHWIDLERGVAEIARVLAPGGRVLLVDEDFTDPTHPEYDRFGGSGDDDDRDGHDHHGFTLVEADQVADLLRTAGLSEVDGSLARMADRPVIRVTARG